MKYVAAFVFVLLGASFTSADRALADGETSHQLPRVGDTYEITMVRDWSQQSDDQSSGSSHDVDTIIERVVAVRPDGLELEYDLPPSTQKEQRASDWKFPAHVLRLPSGELQLLDRADVEARVTKWLRSAKWTRAVCGHWIFTWNAFRIECDPQAIINAVKPFDLRSANVREGAQYKDSDAIAPGTITKTASADDGATFLVRLEADGNVFRRSRAESDIIAAEILQKPITMKAALNTRSKEAISGTISITFEVDRSGNLRRQTKITNLQIKKPDGQTESDTFSQVLKRQLISASDHGQAPVT